MAEITLLDGGMGQELIRRSGKPAAPLWSTQVMIDMPGLVAEVHGAYADAGATMATTNSYAIHRDRLRGGASNHYAADGLELPNLEDQLPDLLAASVKEAAAMRESGRVAGSVGPLGASYRADLHPDLETAVPLYAEIAKALAPGVDVLLFETVPSLTAARACLEAGRQTDRPVWLSITVDDEDGRLLRSGEPIVDLISIAREADALLANCSAPEVMTQALEAMAPANIPLGAYANAFTMITKAFLEGGATANSLEARRDLNPEIYADFAMDWVAQGATIVGGCCETNPAHIAEIARRLNAAGHHIV